MIEIIGIPGVGKTTVVEKLVEDERKYLHWDRAYIDAVGKAFSRKEQPLGSKQFKGLFAKTYGVTPGSLKQLVLIRYLTKVTGLSDKILGRFRSKYPDSLKTIQRSLADHTHDEERIRKVMEWVGLTVEKYMLIDEYIRPTEKHILVDEGFVFRAGSIFVHPDPKQDFVQEDVRDYSHLISLPEKIIYLKSSPTKCISRMKQRRKGYPNFYEGEDEERIKKDLKRYDRCFNIVLDESETMGVDVIRIDAEGDINDLIEAIDHHI